jgi:hypothetical protein
MKFYIEIPDDELFVHGVLVYFALTGDNSEKEAKLLGLGDGAIWDRIGLLETALLIQKEKLKNSMS